MLAVLPFVLLVSTSSQEPVREHHINTLGMSSYAQKLGDVFYQEVKNLLNAEEFEKIIRNRGPEVSTIDGSQLISGFANEMQGMLAKKILAISNIVNETERANIKHVYKKDLKFDYYNANFLNKYKSVSIELSNGSSIIVDQLRDGYREMDFVQSEMFPGERVNFTTSTLQVPVSIYKKDPDVVNGIYMTESLNPVFEANKDQDKTLTWQYFASSTGFFRNYPGVDWGVDEGDIDDYDGRDRSWYLQASHSPKDVVILVDASGSMTGSREHVAQSAIQSIIDTLMDDDFFNILIFQTDVRYLEDCFNGTLVQANSDNKEYLKKLAKGFESHGIANFSAALTTAFQLLKTAKETKTGSNCSQAIMLLTDGATENYEKIFDQYNRNKEVRVFTYIIGRDVKNAAPVKWMACNNKGYYAQIATLADVKINIKQYIHVLSRPMVIEKDYTYKWTNVYMDVGSAGLRLMTTVSMPAFDKLESRAKEGILLGVAGVDVPISEMNKFTPAYMLGFNGYTFAITNNGYIIFHPELRPKYVTNKGVDKDKPNYNSVDLSEVEMYDFLAVQGIDPHTNRTTTFLTQKEELRRRMVDGETGTHSLSNVVYHVSDWTRAAVRQMQYYFILLDKTPFRLGVALDRHFGLTKFKLRDTYIDDSRTLEDALTESFEFYSNSGSRLVTKLQLDDANSSAIYCVIPEDYSEKSQLKAVRNHILNSAQSATKNIKCIEEAIRMVREDAIITYIFARNVWRPRDESESRNRFSSYRSFSSSFHKNIYPEDIVAEFAGTRSGLLRYAIRNSSFGVSFEQSPLHDESFKITASVYSLTDGDKANIVYWVPRVKTTTYITQDPIVSYAHKGVVAVAQLTFAEGGDRRVGPSGKCDMDPDSPALCPRRAVAGYVGLYVSIDKFWSLFIDSISKIATAQEEEKQNNLFTTIKACTESEHIDCYLLDHNGFVVMSENKSSISEFFGAIDGNAMKSLLDARIYETKTLMDMQGMCKAEGKKPGAKKSASPQFTNVILGATQLVAFALNFIFQLMFSFHSINLVALSPWHSFHELMAESVSAPVEIIEWNYDPCDNEKTVYVRNFSMPEKTGGVGGGSNQPAANTFTCVGADGSRCDRDFLFQEISQTNLLFVVVMNKVACECAHEQISLDFSRKVYNNTDEKCERLANAKHRKRPPECHSFHPDEDSKHCGDSWNIRTELWLLMLLLFVHHFTISNFN